MKQYAKPYMHYEEDALRNTNKFKNAPSNASDCRTLKELKSWREAQRAQVKAFVPKQYQHYPNQAVESTYARNKARIESEQKERAAEARTNHTEINTTAQQATGASKEAGTQDSTIEKAQGASSKADGPARGASDHTAEMAGAAQRVSKAPKRESPQSAAQTKALSSHNSKIDSNLVAVHTSLVATDATSRITLVVGIAACLLGAVAYTVVRAHHRQQQLEDVVGGYVLHP